MADRAPFRFHCPTEIQFGAGCLAHLRDYAPAFAQRPLVVTGKSSARKSGALDRVIEFAPGAVVLEGIDENPTDAVVDSAATVCRDAHCDGIIAIGGGSPIDVAKAVAVLATNGGACRDYYGTERYTKTPLPLVAIPTTVGAGSEVTPYSVLVDETDNTKRTIRGRDLFPRRAFVDPELTRTLPKAVIRATALDALSQAMEGIVSLMSTPIADSLAFEAIIRIRRALSPALQDDEDALVELHYAAMVAGIVIAQSGTTLVHGMGYAFTVEFGVAHGIANALLLTPLFQYNAHHLPDKVAAISQALGRPAAPNLEDARDQIGRALHGLFDEIDFSPKAADAGIEQDRLPWFARAIHQQSDRLRNQVGELTERTVLELYQQAYDGALV